MLDKIAKVVVGAAPNQKTYSVHEMILRTHSRFIDKALTDNVLTGKEKKTVTLRFQDTDPEVFELFLQWSYFQNLVIDGNELPSGHNLVRLWVFAKIYDAPVLQNQVIDRIELRRQMDKIVAGDHLNYVYEHTDADSPLRRLMLVYIACYLTTEQFVIAVQQLDADVLVDLALHFRMKADETDSVQELKMEDYHVPEE